MCCLGRHDLKLTATDDACHWADGDKVLGRINPSAHLSDLRKTPCDR